MGKGGQGRAKKKGPAKAETAMTDDELLEQAAAENRAAAAAALAEATSKMALDDGCPTKGELLAALDSIVLFDIRSDEDGPRRGRDPILSPAGEYVFYVDPNDAIEAMEARKLTHPDRMAIGCTGLGRAFGLSEGAAFGFQTNARMPMRIQGPTGIINGLGEADARRLCPPSLRKQMNERTSPIPMFSLNELIEGMDVAPYFFSQTDMVSFWMQQTGKKQEELPRTLVLTDLRVLIVRMMQVPNDWKSIQLVPASGTVKWLQAEQAAAQQKAAADAPPADAPPPHQEEEDGPPPLQEDGPPPLQ